MDNSIFYSKSSECTHNLAAVLRWIDCWYSMWMVSSLLEFRAFQISLWVQALMQCISKKKKLRHFTTGFTISAVNIYFFYCMQYIPSEMNFDCDHLVTKWCSLDCIYCVSVCVWMAKNVMIFNSGIIVA